MNRVKIQSAAAAPLRRTSLDRVSWTVARARDALAQWSELRRQRRNLRALDARMLKDIGLSRADVEWESSKPVWRI